jgi:hypothetical protein
MTDLSIKSSVLNFCKSCRTCKQELPISNFAKNNANKKDGLQEVCKSCDNIRQKKRRKDKKQEMQAWSKEYRKKNYHDMTFRLQGLLNASRCRAKEKNLPHTITREDLFELYPIDGLCPVFGFPLQWNGEGFRETSPSIDRIIPELGYVKENIQIISFKANRIKGYATVDDLETVLAYLKKV